MGRHIIPVAFTILTVAQEAFSQSAEIETDRPDQTEASSVVGKGMIQLEMGFVFNREHAEFYDQGPLQKTNDFASTLIRVGLTDVIELRLISGYTEFDSGFPDTAVISGIQPLSIGTKLQLARENGFWPEIAFIGHVTMPWFGEDAFTPKYATPDFRFSLAHTLSDRFSLGYNLGMAWEDAVSSFEYTIALGAGIVGPLGAFAEMYGERSATLGWQNNLHFGVTLLATPDLQLDASYSFSISDRSDFRYFNTGVSYRFRGWD